VTDHWHSDPETGCGLMLLGCFGAVLLGLALIVWRVLR
jgi:hypothetical protein